MAEDNIEQSKIETYIDQQAAVTGRAFRDITSLEFGDLNLNDKDFVTIVKKQYQEKYNRQLTSQDIHEMLKDIVQCTRHNGGEFKQRYLDGFNAQLEAEDRFTPEELPQLINGLGTMEASFQVWEEQQSKENAEPLRETETTVPISAPIGGDGEPINENQEQTVLDDKEFEAFLRQNNIDPQQFLAEPEKYKDIRDKYEKLKNEPENGKQENDDNSQKPEDEPTIAGNDENAPTSADKSWHPAVEEKLKKYSLDNDSTYELIETEDNSFAFNLFPSENKKKKGMTDLTVKYTTPDYMVVNGKDGDVPSVEDFKALTKDMPEINLGIADDKYAARLMVAQLENGGKIRDIPKISELKGAEPEMIERLKAFKEKAVKDSSLKQKRDRIRELRGLSLAGRVVKMNDEEYTKFKESEKDGLLKDAKPDEMELLDKIRLGKDSEDYKKLSDEEKAKVDKVHENLDKLDKNSERNKILEARGIIRSSRTVERKEDGRVETKINSDADRNKMSQAMKLIKQNAADRQFG